MTCSQQPVSGWYAAPEHVLVICNEAAPLQRGEPHELLADMETLETAREIADALAVDQAVTLVTVQDEEDLVAALAAFDLDTTLVFNRCESLHGLPASESAITRVLDGFGACYVGGGTANLDACADKACTKARLRTHGIATAPYQVFHRVDEPVTAPLPAIVKPLLEDGSVGIGVDAVVCSVDALRRRVDYVLSVYRQPALVEMFLDGREFAVSIWGNGGGQVVGVGETVFPGCDDLLRRVDDFDSKWISDRFPTLFPAVLAENLRQRVERLGLAAYNAMQCRDYGRIDIREKEGQLYVLEVNPNPDLAAGTCFVRAARAAGYGYGQMLAQIGRFAWQRRGER